MELKVTENIILRTWKPEDAPILFSLVDANREYLQPWLQWVPNIKEVGDTLKFIQTSSDDPTSENGVEFGVWENDKLVGCLGLHEVSKDNKKTSVGYWLGADSQGRGIMTKSMNRLIKYCFNELGLNRIELRAATGNQASQGVAKRLGFTQEGISREAEVVNGKMLDDVVYSLLRSEYSK